MNTRSFKLFVGLTSLAMVALLLTQGYWVYNSLKQERKNFRELVQIAGREIDQRTWNYFSSDYPVDFPSPVSVVEDQTSLQSPSSEPAVRRLEASKFEGYYKFGEDSIPVYSPNFQHDSISTSEIDSIIAEVVNELGLPRQYTFQIIPQSRSSQLALHETSSRSQRFIAARPIKIPDPRDLDEPKSIQVYFPSTMGQTILRMGWLALFNLLLIVFIGGLFGYAFKIMFRQKRIQQIRKDFISNLSHEYRTPVASVSLALEGLINYSLDKDEEKRKTYLEMARKENRRLGIMIERTLNLAAYESGNIRLKMRKVSVHDLIKEVISNFEIHMERQRGVMNANLEADNDIVWADPDHLLQCLYNLVDNANKFSAGKPNIDIKTWNSGANQFHVVVHDKGIGIPVSKQNQIFKAYTRIHEGGPAVKGFGIGLAYVKKIVELHQGHITVQSKPGEGSSFFINLPVWNGK